VVELLKQKGASEIVVFGGGIIPKEDIPVLKEKGIAAIFTPGTPTQDIVDWINSSVSTNV
jgi:methylmalonyl-CoA mutase C-terminal domain/subunit